MNWKEYTAGFENIINGSFTDAPYDKPNYVNYAKLNKSRVSRWEKKIELSDDLKNVLSQISSPQTWILITEHWCGDAANSSPIIKKMSEQSNLITFDIQFRDKEPFLINQYLTNGGKSIPKLIVRDENGKDLFTWGPRPSGAQELVMSHKDSTLITAEKQAALQIWYNQDKGESTQEELVNYLKETL